MEENVNNDICRVCRSEGTNQEPLFYPCKCSGSMRYIHQDCLMEWLKMSKRTTCEVCKHKYQQTPIYKQNMPKTIPLKIIIKRITIILGLKVYKVIIFGVILGIWLVFLPFVSMFVCRFCFYLANRMLSTKNHQALYSKAFATSIKLTESNRQVVFMLLGEYLKECFKGQLICCSVVVFFICGFLLREWIINHRLVNDNHANTPTDNITHSPTILDEAETENNLNNETPNQDSGEISPISISNRGIRRQYNEDIENPQNILRSRMSQSSNLSLSTNTQPRQLHRRYASANFNEANQPPSENEQENDTGFRRTQTQRVLRSHDRNRNTSSDSLNGIFSGTANEDSRNHSLEARRNIQNAIDRDIMYYDQIIQDENTPQQPSSVNLDTENNSENLATSSDQPSIIDNAHNRGMEARLNEPIWEAPNPVLVENNLNADNNNEDDDFGGIIEILGLNGNISNALQNSGLLFLLVSVFVMLFVFVPYLTGKIVTSIQYGKVARYVVSNVWPFSSFYAIIEAVSKKTVELVRNLAPQFIMKNGAMIGENKLARLYAEFNNLLRENELDKTLNIALGVTTLLVAFYAICANLQPVFGYEIKLKAQKVYKVSKKILKVGVFVTIEVIIFPMYCGFLIKLTTVPLLGNFYNNPFISSPLSFPIVHWCIGTVYMYFIAKIVQICRKILRPGVMWFVRDPSDSRFNPIAEIIDRGPYIQAKKILISAFFYTMYIFVVVGTSIKTMELLFRRSSFVRLPIDFSSSDNSNIVFELVFSYPMFMVAKRYLKLNILRHSLERVFKVLSKFLRISHFMMGKQYPSEKLSIVPKTLKGCLQMLTLTKKDLIKSENVTVYISNVYYRVPKNDRSILVGEDMSIVRVDKFNRPLKFLAKNSPMRNLSRTRVVTSPPNLKIRVITLLILLWLFFGMLLFSILTVPLICGNIMLGSLRDKFSGVFVYIFGINLSLVAFFLISLIRDVVANRSAVVVEKLKSVVYCVLMFGIVFSSGCFAKSLLKTLSVYKYISQTEINEHYSSVKLGGFLLAIVYLLAKISYSTPATNTIVELLRLQSVENGSVSTLVHKIGKKFYTITVAVYIFYYMVVLLGKNIPSIANLNHDMVITFGVMIFVLLPAVISAKNTLNAKIINVVREQEYVVGRMIHNFDNSSST